MKKSLFYLIVAVALSGCYSGPQGELVGVYPREEWVQVNPYGMNYIHFGSFTMGPSDQEVAYALNNRSKTVTIPAFYIDQHEISNNEYRQFVFWVSWQRARARYHKVLGSSPTFSTKHYTCLSSAVGGLK